MNQTVRQTTLDVYAKPLEPPAKNYVTQYQYDLQKQKVSRLRDDLAKSNVRVCFFFSYVFLFILKFLESLENH